MTYDSIKPLLFYQTPKSKEAISVDFFNRIFSIHPYINEMRITATNLASDLVLAKTIISGYSNIVTHSF